MACNCEGKQYNVSFGCCEPVLAPIENYYTKYQIDKMIESATTSGCCITPEEVESAITSAITYVEGEIPSLSGYATEQWVLDKHYISGVDLSDYALKSEIPTVPTSNTAFTNDAGYLTEDDYPDLASYATKEWVINQNYAINSELIQYITNLQNQIDSLKEQISGCCGSTGETITRWITMIGVNDYTCSGTTKYTKEKEQQSIDGGNTWTDTGNYRSGSTVLEENSADCGYVPPIPTDFKYKLTLDNSSVVSAECDSTSAISRDDVSSYSATCVSVEVGDCVTAITECEESWCGAFSYFRNLTSVTIPNSVVTIGNNSFNYCTSLTSVEIPESVTSLGDYSFGHCSGLTSCTIGSGVTSIGFLAFADTSLEEVTIHDAVTEIGDGCFAQITPLTSVTIGSGVTSIGGAAFSGCTNLTSVTINATVPPTIGVWDSKHDPFENTNNCPIYVPAASVNIYKTATYWSQYASRIQAIQ